MCTSRRPRRVKVLFPTASRCAADSRDEAAFFTVEDRLSIVAGSAASSTVRPMRLWTAPLADVHPSLTDERAALLHFLSALSPDEWLVDTAAPGWTVKDLALHLLDDDLGWLSRLRDRDRSGGLDTSDSTSFVNALATKNQR